MLSLSVLGMLHTAGEALGLRELSSDGEKVVWTESCSTVIRVDFEMRRKGIILSRNVGVNAKWKSVTKAQGRCEVVVLVDTEGGSTCCLRKRISVRQLNGNVVRAKLKRSFGDKKTGMQIMVHLGEEIF